MFEIFEHTADLGLRVRADSLDALFADAASGFFSIIVANLDDVRPVQNLTLRVEGSRRDELLFDWLNELLYTFETRRLLLSRFDVSVGPDYVEGRAWGEPLDPQRHHLEHEVKAITYHRLRVEADAQGWLAEVIVDI